MAKRKAITEDLIYMSERPSKRHQNGGNSLVEAFARLFSQHYLDQLPHEILLNIFRHFAEPWVMTDELADWTVYTLDRESRVRQQALIALTKTCRSLNGPATSILYRCAHLRTWRSVTFFVSAFWTQPRLAQLVKQVSCPHEVLMYIPYVFLNTNGSDYPRMPPGHVHHTKHRLSSAPSGLFGPFRDSYSSTLMHGRTLCRVLDHVPELRALSVASWTPWWTNYPVSPSGRPLEHLTRLSMAVPFQPEAFMRRLRTSYPILSWLSPSTLGQHRALKQLELIHPCGKWIAHLVTVEPSSESMSSGVEKYVESLTTLKHNGGGSAEWDLMSLREGVFSPAHLRSLHFAGQGRKCINDCKSAQAQGWNLNRFLATTGRGVRTLSLDWENDRPQSGHLWPLGMLTSLPMLTTLTHLTVSMQVLFRSPRYFYPQIEAVLDAPVTELQRIFPPSLRVLRINEFMPAVLCPDLPQRAEDASVLRYNISMVRFVDTLRVYWLDLRRDRELWYKYFLKLERHPRQADVPPRRMLRWLVGPLRHEDVGKEFGRVWRIYERNPDCPEAKARAARHGSDSSQ
ncbi:hypothetical protein diail_397 [Diaporthe ilicicola]|nr:hypothetical protein diail_397 [Diaporthe ilicicola]